MRANITTKQAGIIYGSWKRGNLEARKMSEIAITGRTIKGSFIGAPLQSCRPVDVPTGRRGTVTIDGAVYERTVYERTVWRNARRSTVAARFVIVDGINYEVEG